MARGTDPKNKSSTEQLLLRAVEQALELEKVADHHPSTMNPRQSLEWKDRCDELLDKLRKTVQPLSPAEFGFLVHLLYDHKGYSNREKLTVVREWVDARQPVPIVKQLLGVLIKRRKERRNKKDA